MIAEGQQGCTSVFEIQVKMLFLYQPPGTTNQLTNCFRLTHLLDSEQTTLLSSLENATRTVLVYNGVTKQVTLTFNRDTKYFVRRKIAQSRTINFLSRTIRLQKSAQYSFFFPPPVRRPAFKAFTLLRPALKVIHSWVCIQIQANHFRKQLLVVSASNSS